MGWKDWTYWLKGGIIAIPISILVIPSSIIITMFFLGAGDDVVWFLAPEFFGAALVLGMRGTPAGLTETITTLIFASLIFLVRVFVIGAVLGVIYGIFVARNKGKLFLICLVLLWIALLFFASYRAKNIWHAYDSISSPKECNNIFKKVIDNFDTNQCYKHLAVKNKDLNICNNIKNPSSIEKTPEDFKWFCYEEVAHIKDDPSICELIPEETYNEHNVRTGRRDGCFGWFKICDKIKDIGLRNKCFQRLG